MLGFPPYGSFPVFPDPLRSATRSDHTDSIGNQEPRSAHGLSAIRTLNANFRVAALSAYYV